MDIGTWLRGLGLDQYEAVFRDNAIDAEVLPALSEADLEKLGVVLGHRKRILRSIGDRRAAVPAVEEARERPIESAERRQLTVMFSDLVGSTALSARLDPEDLREVIAAYHRAVAPTVAGFDGFVAKYMGDGVLVYFGYPRAHEDDAERAVRAGLGVIDGVGRLDVKSVELQARIGIATGLVVVGDLIGEGSAHEQSVVGETPNLAARLQALAAPNAVVIAAATRRLVGDLFEYLDLGTVEMKGIAAPVPAWQVLRPSAVESRFEALRGSALTPLIGRDEEIDLLLRRWARAKAGDGQVVLISGEPGIGKSRLTAELEERLCDEPHLSLRYSCSPYHQDSALYPFTDQFGRTAGFTRDDPPAARLEKLEALLARSAPPEEDVALLADLMSLPASERHPLPDLSPQRKKELTLKALIRRLEGLARRQPLIVVFEDAHWIDPTSRELLDLTVERVAGLPVLLIVTFRLEFQSPWTGLPQVTMLTLNRLDHQDRTVLVERIAGGEELPDDVVAQITDRTDGVPLFVEELTKSVLESGVPLAGIPTTLHDSLMARLDRLGPVRRVAQTGAAIGREFSYALLHTVSRLPEDELKDSLASLVSSELVFQRGTPPDAIYSFKHALVQDAAHGSLLRSSRHQLHAQIAAALETRSPELMDSQPELFAQHYAEAGDVEKSVTFWGKAGHRSAARSAMAEAAVQFRKGLDELTRLPDTPARWRQELEFCSALSAVLQALKGNSAAETGHFRARALELWKQLGAPPDYLRVPFAQALHHLVRGELGAAQSLDEQLLQLSWQRGDTGGLILAHLSCGRNQWFLGNFLSSRLHFEELLAVYDPNCHGSVLHRADVHPRVISQAYLGDVLFCLGYIDQALMHSNAAVAEARRLAHPPSLAGSLQLNALLLSLVCDTSALSERANELTSLATEQDFAYWRGHETIYRGWVTVKNGDLAQGIALLRRGSMAPTWMPYYVALLAKASEMAGNVEEGQTLLNEALQVIETMGLRWFAAELNRCKGELLLRQGHSEDAEELYRKALGIAREQKARLWELRAAVSLARLRCDQGRRGEAHDLLAPVYGWFTEGFDTPDLKEAKALLGELR